MRLLLVTFFLVLMSSVAFADPVELIQCEPGGEFGNLLNIKLSRDYEYGQMVIKRKKAATDFIRDLTKFKGGNYRLDLAAKGSFEGLTLQYRKKGETEFLVVQASIDCILSGQNELIPEQTTESVDMTSVPSQSDSDEQDIGFDF